MLIPSRNTRIAIGLTLAVVAGAVLVQSHRAKVDLGVFTLPVYLALFAALGLLITSDRSSSDLSAALRQRSQPKSVNPNVPMRQQSSDALGRIALALVVVLVLGLGLFWNLNEGFAGKDHPIVTKLLIGGCMLVFFGVTIATSDGIKNILRKILK